jgi:citronellol/citronellal dehydrogenase
MASRTNLSGMTLFITGASRGIGKAIALRAAQDGANIIIAAKTAEPHPRLPGTIYTAAEEIEAAGGKALPCIVDVRDAAAVTAAVEAGVERFGGIDILINNASAIDLRGTLQLPVKKFDLMHSVNARGTWLCSQAVLPHLLKSEHGHILNISPPINLAPHWFQDHCAYTMAKYGMSLCVLGMAGEFRSQVAVNALWPRTAIATAAVRNLLGGEIVCSQSRTPQIMADAAHAILLRDSADAANGGNFFIDDDVLAELGVTDFEQYAVDPSQDLVTDFFLDDAGPNILKP